MITTCTKTFADLPFAHRQHNHDGHCALIHGHNWSFTFEFGATALDADGFVIDFGKLKWLRKELEELFDHTLVLNESDPQLGYLRRHLCEEIIPRDGGDPIYVPVFAKIVVVPNCGAEGLAKFLTDRFNPMLAELTNGRVSIASIIAEEDSRNSAKVSR